MKLSDKTLKAIKFRVDMFENAVSSGGCEFYDTAERMRDIYKGIHWPNEPDCEHRVTVNYAQVNVDILHASISYTEPEFEIVPRTPEAEKNAPFQKMGLTKVMEDIGALQKTRRVLQDSIICGLGVAFTGWRYETIDEAAQEGIPDRPEEPVQNMPDYLPEEPYPTLMQPNPEEVGPMGMMMPNIGIPEEMGGMMPPPDMTGTPEEYESNVFEEEYESEELENIVWDNPVIRRISPALFFVDPDHDDLSDLSDARFVIEKILLPLEDVQDDERYTSVRHKLKGTSVVSSDYLTCDMHNDTHARRVTLFSYWQKAGRIHVVMSDEFPDEPLYVEEWPYPFNSYPYDCLVHRNIPDEQAPQGQIEPAETLVKELDLYRSRACSHDDRFAKGIIPYDGQAITDDGKRAMRSGEDGAFVECTRDPNGVFGQFPGAPLPSEVYQHQNDVKQDLSNMMAVDDWMRGTPDKTRRTKGEVDTITGRAAVRGQNIQREFERYMERIASKVLRLLQDERFCDTTRWGRITGQENFVEWDNANIKGESNVRVIVNSMRIQTPEGEQQKWAQIMQALGPLAQAGGINIGPIIEEALKAYNVSPSKVKEITGKGNPMLSQLQESIAKIGQMGQQMLQQIEVIDKTTQKLDQRISSLEQQIDVNKADLKTRSEVASKQKVTDMKVAAAKQKMLQKEITMRQDYQLKSHQAALDTKHKQDSHRLDTASSIHNMHQENKNQEQVRRLKAIQTLNKAKQATQEKPEKEKSKENE